LFGIACLFSIFIMMQCFSAIIEDHSHFSTVMGMNRNYRIFLPSDYYNFGKRYPVLYWFHGSGGNSKQDTYKAEFEAYINNHDMIIVNVDGTTPSKSTWDYGLAYEYDKRTQEGKAAMTGMHFSKYIRELIGVIDSQYRTIADRDHRAVSGQSMGGLMSPWIASQNKDMFGSASLFSPSPDAAMFGPINKEVCFTNRELYRSLKGIPLRLTYANGDRYRQYYFDQKAIWDLADFTFEFHEGKYPDHRAVDIPAQFDFHMAEFKKVHPFPKNWNHADPFTDFKVWNYEVNVIRESGAFTILEKVTPSGMVLCSRRFLPNGPLIQTEKIAVTTDAIYAPLKYYIITDFNLSTSDIKTNRLQSDANGRLKISMDGGGHAIGINSSAKGAKLFLIPNRNREEVYSEDGQECTMCFTLVNLGTSASGPVHIKATTPKPYLILNKDSFTLKSLEPGKQIKLKDLVLYKINGYKFGGLDSEDFISRISLEVRCNDSVQDIQNIFVYPVPKTSFLPNESDFLILDGTCKSVEIYNNEKHEILIQKVSGGIGNGNSIPEPGETVELYVRLPQGLGPKDQNTFHPAFLMNIDESPWVSVPELRFNIRGAEWSGAPNLQSKIKISPDTPTGTLLNLWLKCESYEFNEEGYTRLIQRHFSDFRRVALKISSNKK
jgi:hypothetical protein